MNVPRTPRPAHSNGEAASLNAVILRESDRATMFHALAKADAICTVAEMEDAFSQIEVLRGVERPVLWAWVLRQRWFGGKARTLVGWAVVGHWDEAGLVALEVTYADGKEVYALPLAWAAEAPEDAVIFRKDGRVLCDATVLPEFRAWLFRALGCGEDAPPSRVLKAEQSNTSLIYGERLFVKLYRRLAVGINPDAELTRFLSEVARFQNVPEFVGEVKWDGASLALATALTHNEGDAWPLALAAARGFYETGEMGPWLERAALLGRRTGEMHAALASAKEPDFVAEPFADSDLREVKIEIARLDASNRATIASRAASELEQRFLSSPAKRISVELPAGAVKTRTHGDYHLGQVLWTGRDFVIIDFEGEPSRSLAERRAKRSPLRDVAGMLRSFHYAAHAAGSNIGAEKWATASQDAFFAAWREAAPSLVAGAGLLPLFIAEKALYELAYELNNRPAWGYIPLQALV